MTKIPSFALVMLALGVATASHAQPSGTDTDADGGAPPPTLPVQTGPGWQVAFNVGAQSDYVFRGISQTDERPSGFAGVDVTYQQQWYVGGWTSNVDFRPSGDTSTRQEFDLYGGWRPTLAGINIDLGYIYYGYRDQPVGLRESYAETYLRGSHAFGPVTVGAALFYSNNFPGSSRHADYGEANIAYAIDSAWTLAFIFFLSRNTRDRLPSASDRLPPACA